MDNSETNDKQVVIVIGAGLSRRDHIHAIANNLVHAGIVDCFSVAVHQLENIRKTITPVDFRREVLNIASPTPYDGRNHFRPQDKIPVPKPYKRNRHKL